MSFKEYALVTGTTSGIGKAFCELLAELGFNLVLVSRDSQRMVKQSLELQNRYKDIQIQIIEADLSNLAQIKKIELRLKSNKDPVSVLINNAGFGINSSFSSSAVQSQENLINCMVMTPMKLTHSAIKTMESIGGG